jgi:hypothetical protein
MSTEDIVRWLRDRDLIKDLLVRYAHAVDGGDWTTVRSCFAVDAVVAGILVREPIGPYLEALEASVAPYERTMHFIGSQLVKLEPGADVARLETYAVAYHLETAESGREQLVVGVVYRDTVKRSGEMWVITRRAVESKWVQGPMPRPEQPSSSVS